MLNFLRRRSKQPERQYRPVDYPTGLAVDTEGGVYFIKGKTKYKVFSKRVEQSWRFAPVPGSLASVAQFTYGGYLGFRDGSLIKNLADGKIYLVSGNKRRHIKSPDVFIRYGLDRNLVFEVSEAEANLHQEGEPLV